MKNIEVVAAIIIKNSQILVTQRGYGQFKHMWEFPGGKIEDGETKENAIIREIKEELNAQIKIVSFLNTIEYDYETFHLIMHNYICSLDTDITLLEHEDMKWINKEELLTINFLPADKLVLKELFNFLVQY